MSSNLRAKSIIGHVTDSAGNILRNAVITIKQAIPSGSFTIDSFKSDGDGYFESKPIQNGVYDIYESGIHITRVIHTPDSNSIQCFKPSRQNYDYAGTGNFSLLASQFNLGSFKYFLQIEPEGNNSVYGNNYPIYDQELSDVDGEFYKMYIFLGMKPESRITTTRFDIEYFTPLTETQKNYRRIKWVGVPGIKFYKNSKIVVPLDYFSIIANFEKKVNGSAYITVTSYSEANGTLVVSGDPEDDIFQNFISQMIVGSIVKLNIGDGIINWYGILDSIDKSGTQYNLNFEKWKSSRFISDVAQINLAVNYANIYNGMFQGIIDINEEANEKFTVVENVYAQSGVDEVYNYSQFLVPS